MKNILFFLLISFLLFFGTSYILKNNKNKIKHIENKTYNIEFSPCGKIELLKIPQRILTSHQTYNDILVAFNMNENIVAVSSKDKFYYDFYTNLNITNKLNDNIIQYSLGRNHYDKELFYSINADIHHIDPITLAMTKGWSRLDVEEICKNIGPFFGNDYSINGKKPSYLIDYKLYTLNEINLKFGEVYKKQDVTQRINDFTENLIKNIQNKIQNINSKTIAIIYLTKKGIVPFDSTSCGYGFTQYKVLKCKDAFKEKGIKTYSYEGNFGTIIDKETLLIANPDVIIINEGIYVDPKYKFFSKRTQLLLNQIETLKRDHLLKDIPAFKNNKIILGGIYDQGPISRIYQLEMFAKQIYPEIFGQFNINHKYSADEQLFSREELREILNVKK